MIEVNLYADMKSFDIEMGGFSVASGYMNERWDERYYKIRSTNQKGKKKKINSVVEVHKNDVPLKTRKTLQKYAKLCRYRIITLKSEAQEQRSCQQPKRF